MEIHLIIGWWVALHQPPSHIIVGRPFLSLVDSSLAALVLSVVDRGRDLISRITFYFHFVCRNELQTYMELLVRNFNPSSLSGLMCRNYISVGWDGSLYDCDFNQQLDLPMKKLRNSGNENKKVYQYFSSKFQDVQVIASDILQLRPERISHLSENTSKFFIISANFNLL